MRKIAAVGALTGWFALFLQLYLILFHPTVGLPAASVPAFVAAVVGYFSFFTILTNILVALVFTALWLVPGADAERSGARSFFLLPATQAGVVVSIAIVGVVYSLVLRQLWDPRGAQKLADTLLHDAIPAAYPVFWLFFAAKAALRLRHALLWLIYPGLYFGYVLARGAVTGEYPYEFLNAKALGYGTVWANAVGLLLAFLGLGLLVVALAKWLSRKLPEGRLAARRLR